MYLKSLAIELAIAESPSADPAMLTASTSQAVRHLIAKDRGRRRKDKDGNPLFVAGPEQTRKVVLSQGTTTVQSFDEVIDLSPVTAPSSKRGRR